MMSDLGLYSSGEQGPRADDKGKPTQFQIACMTLPYSQYPLERALTGLKEAGYRFVAWGNNHRESDGKPQPMLPAWQALAGVHAVPAAHAVQAPPPQTWFEPQLVPSRSGVPRSMQTSRPVAQLVWPAWQEKPEGIQLLPGAHGPQTPAWQARFDPQRAPSERGNPVSVQVETPVAQVVAPA